MSAPHPPADQLGLSAQDAATARMLERHNCSTTGFEHGVVPAAAVVRDGIDRVRLVSFDHGRAVFKGRRPGELVAVCLELNRRPAPPS
jgi:hypothetical protein